MEAAARGWAWWLQKAVKANPPRPPWGEGGRPECWAFLRCRQALNALETHSGGWALGIELKRGVAGWDSPSLAQFPPSWWKKPRAGEQMGTLLCPKPDHSGPTAQA